MTGAAAGALGGASGELGSAHRAGAVAFLVVHGLLAREVEGLFPNAGAGAPVCIRLETDNPTDDVLCETSTGQRAWIQAKHQLAVGKTGTGLAPVVEQWTASIREGSVSPSDALVLAVGGANLTKPLRDLREALRRRRDRNSGSLTGRQQERLKNLQDQIAIIGPDLNEAAVNRLLDAAVIWHVDAADAENCLSGAPVDTSAARLGAAMLGAVYAPVDCPRAMAALSSAARTLARLRSGAVMQEWFDVLRKEKIPVNEHPADVPAARQFARDAELEGYLDWLTREASQLSLSNLGQSIPRMPCPELADGIRVTEAAALTTAQPVADSSARGLLPAVRRYRRLLLRGLPGSGKSVALVQLAARCVAMEHAPTPLLVRLQDLAASIVPGQAMKITNELLARTAAAVYAEADQSLLPEELASRMRNGDALLLLDGLDECRGKRHVVAEALHTWLSTAHQDIDLVLTTRDSAYASASILKLRELALCEPDDLDTTLDRLLEHLASQIDDRGSWIAVRRQWLTDARTGGDDFWRVPLFAVMLVLCAARHSPSELPSSRASVLYQAIEDTTRHWEARFRNALASGALTGRLAEDALMDTFAVLGRALSDEGELPTFTAKSLVADRLVNHFGRPRGEALSQAESILAAWDEAGVFVDSHGEKVIVRARLFTEVATAITVRDLSDQEQRDWILDHIEDSAWHQTLELAAELSPKVVAALAGITAASAAPTAGRVLMHARARGAAAQAEVMIPVWQRLIDCVPTLTDPEERWALVRELAREPLPPALHESALRTLTEAAPERAAITKTFAASSWDFTQGEALWQRESFASMLGSDNPPGLGYADRTGLNSFMVDIDYSEAMLLAGKALIPAFPDYANQVGVASGVVGSDVSWQLQQLLVDEGFENFLPDWIKESRARQSRSYDAFLNRGSFWRPWFDAVTAQQTPAAITSRQAWHLDELAAVVAHMRVGESSANVIPEATAACPAVLAQLTLVIAQCIGIEPAVVSAQAGLLSPLESTDVGELFFRNPIAKAKVPEVEAAAVADHMAALVEIIDRGTPWLQRHAVALLSHLPQGSDREQLFDNFELKLDRYVPHVQSHLALAMVTGAASTAATRLSRFAGHELPAVRAGAAAGAVAWAYLDGRIPGMAEHVATLAKDADAQVRSTLLEALIGQFGGRRSAGTAASGSHPLDIKAVVAALLGPAERWTCPRCGHTNTIESESCANCGNVAPKLSRECEELKILVQQRDTFWLPASNGSTRLY